MKLIIAGMAVAVGNLVTAAAASPIITALVQDDGTTNPGTIGEFSGTGNASSPLGLGHLSSGSYVYIEDAIVGTGAQSVMRFDPDLSGAARFSIMLVPASAEALTGSANPLAFVSLAVDPDTDDIYVMPRDAVTGNLYIIRIPSLGLGSDTYGGPVVFAGSAGLPGYTGGNAPQMALDTTTTPNSIIFTRDDAAAANDGTINGIYRRLFSAAPTDPSTLVATFVQLGPGTTPPWSSGQALGFRALAAIKAGPHAGNIVANNSVGTGAADGDNVLWNVSTNTATLFVEAMGTNRDPIVAFDNGDIAIWAASGANEDINRYSTGSGVGVLIGTIATDAEITAGAPGIPAGMSEQSSAFATDGGVTVALFTSNAPQTLMEISNPTVPAELSVFSAN